MGGHCSGKGSSSRSIALISAFLDRFPFLEIDCLSVIMGEPEEELFFSMSIAESKTVNVKICKNVI